MVIINASNWGLTSHAQQEIYQINPIDSSITSIDSALDPATWRTLYKAFAVCIVDKNTNEWVLVRDHWGNEPLYYHFDGQRLIFGSTIPDVLKHLSPAPSLNQSALLALFTHTQYYNEDTFYESIHRVTPGSMLYFKPKCALRTIPYWQLHQDADDTLYANEKTYLDVFSTLLHEAMHVYTHGETHLGSELSGGLDSSAMLVTAHQQQQHYPLFIHVANEGSCEIEDRHLAEELLTHLKYTNVHFVDATAFEPFAVFDFCAKHFAGVAPYIFFMLAHNIHQAATTQGCKVLLSGAGGDQCVSSHARLDSFLGSLIKKKAYQQAWAELMLNYRVKSTSMPSMLRRAERLLKVSHPKAYYTLSKLGDMGRTLRNYLEHREQHVMPSPYYASIRDYEWDLLQGANSHEVRMRIEYSAVIARALGFEYRYPLLYPKLVEFCYHLPPQQKRQQGVGRYLIRRYLEAYAPQSVYSKQQKIGGILPATLEKCHHYLKEGQFHANVKSPPFQTQLKHKNPHLTLIHYIHSYMLERASI